MDNFDNRLIIFQVKASNICCFLGVSTKFFHNLTFYRLNNRLMVKIINNVFIYRKDQYFLLICSLTPSWFRLSTNVWLTSPLQPLGCCFIIWKSTSISWKLSGAVIPRMLCSASSCLCDVWWENVEVKTAAPLKKNLN